MIINTNKFEYDKNTPDEFGVILTDLESTNNNSEIRKAYAMFNVFYQQVSNEYERVKHEFMTQCTINKDSKETLELQEALRIYYDMMHYLIINWR